MKRTTLSTYIRFALASGEFNAVMIRRQERIKMVWQNIPAAKEVKNHGRLA